MSSSSGVVGPFKDLSFCLTSALDSFVTIHLYVGYTSASLQSLDQFYHLDALLKVLGQLGLSWGRGKETKTFALPLHLPPTINPCARNSVAAIPNNRRIHRRGGTRVILHHLVLTAYILPVGMNGLVFQ
jgi:hypothetical protein